MQRAGKKNGNNNEWQFWQQHNKPLEITSQEMFDKNPIAIGLEYITRLNGTGRRASKPFSGWLCHKAGRLEVQQCKRFLGVPIIIGRKDWLN